MKRFLVFFVFFSLAVSLMAGETYPFLDLNNILSIKRVGNQLIMKTTNGIKTFDLTAQTWSYQPSTSTASKDTIQQATQKGWVTKTDEKGGYRYTYLPAGDSKKSWELDENIPYEAPGLSFQGLFPPKGKKAWFLPCADYVSGGLVYQNTAWLKSPTGLLALDLDKGGLTWYRTYPLLPVLKTQKTGDKTVFLSPEGLYFLEGSAIKSIPLGAAEYPSKCLDMAMVENLVYFLVIPPGDNYPVFEKERLNVFDLDKGTMVSYPLPIGYASHLVVAGNDILGYGIEWDVDEEGGSFNICKGGVFRFSPDKKEMKKLTGLPVVELQLEPLRALSMQPGFDNIVLGHLVYSQEKDNLTPVSSEKVNRRKLGDRDFDEIEKKAYAQPATMEMSEFSSLKVEYQTFTQEGGKAEFKSGYRP